MNNKPNYKVGQVVKIKSLDWYNTYCDDAGNIECGDALMNIKKSQFCGKIVTISSISDVTDTYKIEEDNGQYIWTDEMIEGLVEEETPKSKINDIFFVKNIGWVRITNSYWDSLANEYIYEAIGLNWEGEYDSINQSNIEYQMLPESIIPHTGGDKITLEEYKNNDKEWLFNKLALLDNITALESIHDIFNHLQRDKYPKTYEECCEVLNYKPDFYDADKILIYGYMSDKLRSFQKLLVCRDAYWKLYGEEMGLGKPWDPEFDNLSTNLECFTCSSRVFSFPTEEMRDFFKKNFDPDIEICKELLQ